MRKKYDYPAPDDFEQDKEILLSYDSSEEETERFIEEMRFAFRRAWFEYIEEFES